MSNSKTYTGVVSVVSGSGRTLLQSCHYNSISMRRLFISTWKNHYQGKMKISIQICPDIDEDDLEIINLPNKRIIENGSVQNA